MSRRRLKPYMDILEDLGVDVLEIRATGSNHKRIDVQAKGQRRFFIMPTSASDRRALLNFKCDVRRWVAELNQ